MSQKAQPTPNHKIFQRPSFWAAALVPSLLTLLFYLPALQNDFLNWDDKEIILRNPHLQTFSLPNLAWMFSDLRTGNWEPLTWLSFSLEHLVGGMSPFVYHLDNLLIHSVNTLLVFLLSLRMLGRVSRADSDFPPSILLPSAFLTAALFGLHPLHVESVAWVTERKDLLCGLFYLSSLLAYLAYTLRQDGNRTPYIASLGFFLLALMAKPMAVSLPFVLVLWDFWPLRRTGEGFSRWYGEKVPFFLLSLGVGLLSVFAQDRAHALPSLQDLSPADRFLNAVHSLAFYLVKMLAPFHLTPFYPLPAPGHFFTPGTAAALLAGLALSLGFFLWRQKHPALGAAWLFYLVTVAPVIGLLQVGTQASADRYTYIPLLGFFLLASTGLTRVISSLPRAGLAAVAILLLGLGSLTTLQVGVWKNQVVLWEKVVGEFPGVNPVAYDNLGNAYQSVGRLEDALRAYEEALVIDPNRALSHEGKGLVLRGLGQSEGSFEEFQRAVDLDPNQPIYLLMLGNADRERGKITESIVVLNKAAQLQPQNPAVFHQLALAYGQAGQKEKAQEMNARALSLANEPPHP